MSDLSPFNNNRKIESISDLFTDFKRIFDRFFTDSMSFLSNFQSNSFYMDIKETENEYLVEARLHGFNKEDIDVRFEFGNIIITVVRKVQTDLENESYIRKERSYQKMQRSAYLKNADGRNIKAKFEDGILKIVVPKTEYPYHDSQIEIL